ncbi:MAG: hypothetical protein ACOCP7_02445 [Desulfohalobiaceae bacterium]
MLFSQHKLFAFMRAATLPCLVFIVALGLLFLLLYKKIKFFTLQQYGLVLALAILGLLLFFLLASALLDTLNRYREFKRLRLLFQRHGFQPRLFAPLSGSRCQRDAIQAAARESGFRKEIGLYFQGLGYRWYHLWPDGLDKDPLLFLRPGFLRSFYRLRRTTR